MSHRKQQHYEDEGGGEKVPIWIISFADMITLLLAFFVMLQTMAHEKSQVLFQVGQGSFNRAIAGLGMPDLLFGKQGNSGMDYRKIKYPSQESEHPEVTPDRIIDSDDEKIRHLFEQLRQQLQTQAADWKDKLIDVRSAPIAFAAGQDRLDDAAQRYLAQLALELRQNLSGQRLRLFVIGTAVDAQAGKEQWLLSARRANAVQQQLRTLLAVEIQRGQWELLALGSGGSGQWGQRAGQTHPPITITIFRKEP